MNKLLQFFDNKLLKFGVAFAILFIALYPKLPSVHITHTWVYIRLEDFLIAGLALIWFIQLLRRKITLPFPVASPIILYWIAGLCSLIFSLIFIGPHLANFFPKIAIFSYVRRLEYLILFFIAFSTIKSEQDVKDYLKILFVAVTGAVIYGFGQRWYLTLWTQFPTFFEKYPFCFQSFQTGNEEFAKGIALCLPGDARITSTFAGHYDLAAYLVLVIPLLMAAMFAFKNIFTKIYLFILTFASTILLILTASRISFVAFLFGICSMLIFYHKKKFIVPTLVICIALLFLFSGSTAKRFLETIRFTSVVTNNQGQVIGMAASSLPSELQNKISKNPVFVNAPPPTQNLPTGSSFLTFGGSSKTNVAVVQSSVSNNTARNLNLANGGIEISTVSGSFLIQKALVYDISFTTRFQGEWPTAWHAFMLDPVFGSGFSTITLATDGDYLRLLGESGLFGFISFMLIFMFLGILLKVAGREVTSPIGKGYVYGLAGGIIGLFFNATFIDVFEASKVAEPLWILAGIGAGALLLTYKDTTDYRYYLKKIFTSPIFIAIYLFIIVGILFFPTLSAFFVADDFTWLHWAANTSGKDIIHYFTNSEGFFYRPLDKVLLYVLYTFFSFKPEGYHFFMLVLHFLVGLGIYLFLTKLTQKKFIAFIVSILFLLLSAHAEDLYWIATVSTTLSTVWIIFGLYAWVSYRKNISIIAYLLTCICAIAGVLSYEMAVIFPLLLIATDSYMGALKKKKYTLLEYIPFAIITVGYFFIRRYAHTVAVGGDYSYSLVHFVPNFFGNLVGYIGLLITGEYFLPINTMLRATLRAYPLEIAILLVVIIGGASIGFFKYMQTSRPNPYRSLALYGFSIFIICLLPFIGLGNIAERYVYAASIGFIIMIFALFAYIQDNVEKKAGGYIIISVIAGILMIISGIQATQAAQQWNKAGQITENTLLFLRTKYPNIAPNASVYFVNVPIRKANAWIFPVGLPDGLWFIYRDPSMIIAQVKTIAEAKTASFRKTNVYIFSFDKNGDIKHIK